MLQLHCSDSHGEQIAWNAFSLLFDRECELSWQSVNVARVMVLSFSVISCLMCFIPSWVMASHLLWFCTPLPSLLLSLFASLLLLLLLCVPACQPCALLVFWCLCFWMLPPVLDDSLLDLSALKLISVCCTIRVLAHIHVQSYKRCATNVANVQCILCVQTLR